MIPVLAILALLLPLAAFVVQIFFGKKLYRKGDWVSIGAITGSFVLSCRIAMEAIQAYDPGWRHTLEFVWFTVGSYSFRMGILVDNLAAVMLFVVTTVSLLVHIYSTGYMHGDPKYHRYYAFLGIFSFSMLGLVLSDNLLAIYCFWELVGLSSYLLIGFWSERDAPANAAKKAFIVNRVGDIGMFAGILILWTSLGTLNYAEVFEHVALGHIAGGLLTAAGLLLFCGAVGKSAQFPLHVWLPDAMEGPTPVSALIHAATMVAAGVYMVGRMFPLFTPTALLVIAYIGAITAFFAGTIAIASTDIKKVLAYSTVSQLGYMILAMGVMVPVMGLFHLFTHAFFKALLFLCSGSVIHAVHTQEMPEMGGLKKKMPFTFWTMLIGTVALCGVPPLAGFFSKDAILAGALEFGMHHPLHIGLFLAAVLGAGITTFYMFRLVFLTFYGEPRNEEAHAHAHESPAGMVLPLVILAGMSVIAGWGHWFQDLVLVHDAGAYLPSPAEGSTVAATMAVPQAMAEAGGGHGGGAVHTIAMISSLLVVAVGWFLAFLTYRRDVIDAGEVARSWPRLHRVLYNKYYFDELYDSFIVKPYLAFIEGLRRFDLGVIDGVVNLCGRITVVISEVQGRIDRYIVDGLVNKLGDVILSIGEHSRRLQFGKVQQYLSLSFAVAIVVIVIVGIVLV